MTTTDPDQAWLRDLVLQHNPETPVRPSIYGEGIFLECWRALLKMPVEHGDGEENEMFGAIFAERGDAFTQRDAEVAASFIVWLGTNAGACFLLQGSKRAAETSLGDDIAAYFIEWALWNRRFFHINHARRTSDAIIRESTARDLETMEIVAGWLGTPEGRKFIRSAEAEIDATRKALQEENGRLNRAKERARQLAGDAA